MERWVAIAGICREDGEWARDGRAASPRRKGQEESNSKLRRASPKTCGGPLLLISFYYPRHMPIARLTRHPPFDSSRRLNGAKTNDSRESIEECLRAGESDERRPTHAPLWIENQLHWTQSETETVEIRDGKRPGPSHWPSPALRWRCRNIGAGLAGGQCQRGREPSAEKRPWARSPLVLR